jgi:hypothetical protein
MARALAIQVNPGEHAQLVKYQRHQSAERRLVTLVPRDQQLRDGIGQLSKTITNIREPISLAFLQLRM